MSEIGKHKLSDALKPEKPEISKDQGGKPLTTQETTAEQTREASESEEAHNAEASNRDHMIDIGRGNQQAGRQAQ